MQQTHTIRRARVATVETLYRELKMNRGVAATVVSRLRQPIAAGPPRSARLRQALAVEKGPESNECLDDIVDHNIVSDLQPGDSDQLDPQEAANRAGPASKGLPVRR